MNAGSDATQPTSLAGTIYEKVAHELEAKSGALVVDKRWQVEQGAYSRTFALEPGCVAAWEAGTAEYTLVVGDFESRDHARAAFVGFMAHEDTWDIGVDGAMALSREVDGTVSIRQAVAHGAGKGSRWGLVAGAAVGILFPPSAVATAAVGGAAGAAIGKRQGAKRMQAIAEEIAAGRPVGEIRLIVLVHDERLTTTSD